MTETNKLLVRIIFNIKEGFRSVGTKNEIKCLLRYSTYFGWLVKSASVDNRIKQIIISSILKHFLFHFVKPPSVTLLCTTYQRIKLNQIKTSRILCVATYGQINPPFFTSHSPNHKKVSLPSVLYRRGNLLMVEEERILKWSVWVWR